MGCGSFVFALLLIFFVINPIIDNVQLRKRAAKMTYIHFTHNNLGFSFDYPNDYRLNDRLFYEKHGNYCPECHLSAFFYEDDNEVLAIKINAREPEGPTTPVTMNGNVGKRINGVETGDFYWTRYESYIFSHNGLNIEFRFYGKHINVLEQHILDTLQFE